MKKKLQDGQQQTTFTGSGDFRILQELRRAVEKCKRLLRELDEEYHTRREGIFNTFYREMSRIGTPAMPGEGAYTLPDIVEGFGLNREKFDSSWLKALFRQMILCHIWENHIEESDFEKVFSWRFEEDTFVPDECRVLKCMRNSVDLIWVFYTMQKESMIPQKKDLLSLIPKHFIQKDGSKFDAETIEAYFRRFKKGYRPQGDLKDAMEKLFKR